MSNWEVHKPMDGMSLLSVGEAGSETTYTSNQTDQRYTLPGTSTQNVIIEYTTTHDFNTVVITGLNEYSELILTAYDGATPTAIGTLSGATFAAEARARTTFNAMFTFADETADKFVITFDTGTYATGFNAIFAGSLQYSPVNNFELGAGIDYIHQDNTRVATDSNYSTVDSYIRQESLSYPYMTDEEIKNFQFMIQSTKNKRCLFMRDGAVTHPEEWFLGKVRPAGGTLNNSGANTQQAVLTEDIEWK